MPRPTAEELEHYRFAGRWLGKALLDGHTVPIRFARPLYAAMLPYGTDPAVGQLEDLEAIDAPLVKQLRSLLAMPPLDVDSLGLDFTASYDVPATGKPLTLPLSFTASDAKASDAAKDVTSANVAEYVEARWRQRVTVDVEAQVAALVEGFGVLPRASLTLLTPTLLEEMLCGSPTIDHHDWQAHSDYLGAFQPPPRSLITKHPQKVVAWFWELVASFSQEQRQRLLRFVTGSCGVPVGGFARLAGNDGTTRRFTLQPLDASEKLPKAHTCFNRLDLPLYSSKEELTAILTHLISVDSAIVGFGMD
jgi:hypothetical protein